MRPPLSDDLRVRHVLDAIKEIESYLQNVSLEVFLANSEKRFATIKQLEIIGESCIPIRLELHSNNSIPAAYWFRIAEKEREGAMMLNKAAMRKKEMKYVTGGISVCL
jgi:uncharacterized protein with HEPN domain